LTKLFPINTLYALFIGENMISFGQYLTEVFDTQVPYTQIAPNQFRAVSGDIAYLYNISFMRKNGDHYIDISFRILYDNNSPKLKTAKSTFQVFAAAQEILTQYLVKYPNYGVAFVGDKSRERLYSRFANKIAEKIGGTVTKKATLNRQILYMIAPHPAHKDYDYGR
jgi:hypothetical protein